MEYCFLHNGVRLPLVGFGTWDLRGQECLRVVRTALLSGYRLLDTAQMYGNEAMVGQAIRDSGIRRENIFLTSKLYRPSASYTRAKDGIKESLRTLQTSYLDLMLIHEPYATAPAMYRALEEAYEAGMVRAIGVSNFNAKDYEKLLASCRIVPMVNQVEAHVYYPRRALQQLLTSYGTAMQAWSPLTARKKPIFSEPLLIQIGAQYRKSAAQVALRYLVQRGISVIPKSSHRKRMEENIDLFNFVLNEADMEQIEQLGQQGTSLFGWYDD